MAIFHRFFLNRAYDIAFFPLRGIAGFVAEVLRYGEFSRYIALSVTVAAALLFSSGCGGKKVAIDLDDEDEYTIALKDFEDGKYMEARQGFERLLYNHPGSELCDDAQFHLGETYFLEEDYFMAALEYSKLIRKYLTSTYQEIAQFRLALCSFEQMNPYTLDQESTYQAIEEFSIYLFKYPDGVHAEEVRTKLHDCRNRLARKEYENGRFYMKRNHPASARIYFQEVISRYGDTDWHLPSLFELGESYLKEERYLEADSIFKSIPLSEVPPELAKKTRGKRDLIRERMTQN
jgi:outer membrane protein assembly factor BamD